MTTNDTITILGKEYVFDSLPDDIKGMAKMYTKWKQEAKEASLKSEAACRDLAKEMGERLENKKKVSAYTSTLTELGEEIVEFK